MPGPRIRALYVTSLVLAAVATALILASEPGSGSASAAARPGLLWAGTALAVVAGIPALIAWVGALINTARAHQWLWFAGLLVFSAVTLLVYVIVLPSGRGRLSTGYPHAGAPA